MEFQELLNIGDNKYSSFNFYEALEYYIIFGQRKRELTVLNNQLPTS